MYTIGYIGSPAEYGLSNIFEGGINIMKKYLAEAIGTFTLVFLGCGTAMLVGCDAEFGGGYVLTAMAFGLVIVAMAYSIGNVSGCHINPAVSLGCLLSGGRITGSRV